MASVEKKTETVVVERIMMQLSIEEAQLILDLCYMCGGSPGNSRRGLANEIARVIRTTGLNTDYSRDNGYRPPDVKNGSNIYFEDKTNG